MEEVAPPPCFEFSSFQQWEIAFIYAFVCTFNPHKDIVPSFYKLPDFSPQELQLEIQKESSNLINQIICSSIGNVLNRKNPIESFKISLQQLVTDKMKAFEIDFDSNPLLKENFNFLTTDVKLYLLHSMIEWQLQDSLAIKSILEHYNTNTSKDERNPIIAYPIGVDSKKQNYWQFGDSCWIWREKPHFKATYEWETVCRSRQELEELVNSLSNANRAEKALIKVIKEQVYEIADKEERKKQRKERAELRKLMPPPEVFITPTQLRSRGSGKERVRYNYDDYENIEEDQNDDDKDNDNDNDFEEEEEEENISTKRSFRKKASSPVNRPAPTRWSSRLHGSSPPAAIESLQDMNSVMNIDSQKVNYEDEDIKMDTISPSANIIDTNPSESGMENM